MKKRLLLLAFSLATALLSHAEGIGTWKNYLAYSDITDVQQGGNMLYVLASESLFTYNTNDQSIITYDKVNGLNDCVIQLIAWCQAAKKLVIIYDDGNIDLMNGSGNVSNMADYYDKTMTDDKTIYGIDIIDKYAYVSTGFGIVKINVADEEITNSYNLGFRVDYCYIEGNEIFAASSTNGIYSASLSDNILDRSVWSYTAPYVAKNKTIDPDLLAIAQQLSPGGPKENWFFCLRYLNDRLYTAGGFFLSGIGSANRPGTIQILNDGEWSWCNEDVATLSDTQFRDINCVTADPRDPNHIFAGGKTGLYEFENNRFVRFYSDDNSPIHTAQENGVDLGKNTILIHGLLFDKDANLWILNSLAPENVLIEYTSDREFKSFYFNELINNGTGLAGLMNPMQDSRGLIWFVNNNHQKPSFYCFEPSTEALAAFVPDYNQDGSAFAIYRTSCIAEDLDGNMWVGTDLGPLVLYSQYITSDNPVYTQVKVPRNDGTNYADYLLSGIEILSLAIDGAGRKWFGTNGDGVYLISTDNMTQLEHFTAADSPLLSDIIWSIDINNATGEVFFGTDNGLCSYFSDASEPSEKMTKDNVYAYPNPVRPDYTGKITVTGLTLDADVKIVTANGTLVAEGRSNGGTFTWDGCDSKGNRVVSGVYMVETATSEGKKGTVCKIAIVR